MNRFFDREIIFELHYNNVNRYNFEPDFFMEKVQQDSILINVAIKVNTQVLKDWYVDGKEYTILVFPVNDNKSIINFIPSLYRTCTIIRTQVAPLTNGGKPKRGKMITQRSSKKGPTERARNPAKHSELTGRKK